MGKTRVISIVLPMVLCHAAQAHRPIFSKKAATDPKTAVMISQPAISQVIYREITEDSEQVWLEKTSRSNYLRVQEQRTSPRIVSKSQGSSKSTLPELTPGFSVVRLSFYRSPDAIILSRTFLQGEKENYGCPLERGNLLGWPSGLSSPNGRRGSGNSMR
jgi:hypothetical protein